jgi:mono/diheme cytochrome c family protein
MKLEFLLLKLMKMKTKLPAKITIGALLLGCLAWSARADDADQLWNVNCAACHGKDGKGQTMMGHMLGIKDLTDPKVQDSLTDAQATKDIKDGITVNGQNKMKAFGDKLSDEQITNLVAHVRSFKPTK